MIEFNSIFLCSECAKDIRLKELIKSMANNGKCTCCNETNLIIDTKSNEFIQMTKALIRYHYSEWEYNEHFGGEFYLSLFNEENLFFNIQRFINPAVYDELLERIESFKVYENYENGVSIFGGHFNGEQNSLFESIKNTMSIRIKNIEYNLRSENYFKFEDEITTMLSEYLTFCKHKVHKGTEFYRARIGYKDKKKSTLGNMFFGETVFVPYSNTEIGAPRPLFAGVGRLNRVGVSYLYCATDQNTAIAEIRPHPGDIVSIGKFLTNKDLEIFDLTERQFLNFYKSDEDLDKFYKLNTFIELMRKVIPPSERHSYSITQLVADCIRRLNFDGILFPSSVGKGANLVVFNPDQLSYTFENAGVFEVSEVRYDHFQRKWKKEIGEIE